MKIEKLTDNKIRVIVNPTDLNIEKVDINLIINKALEYQNFFSKVLEQAKEELNFDTTNCKLLIEAFSISDDILIFTITKYSSNEKTSTTNNTKKKLIAKRKSINISKKNLICKFQTFDEFCDFCNCIYSFKYFDMKQFSKNISLYLYHDTYYLVIKSIDTSYKNIKTFYHIMSEFSICNSFSSSFENKLIEHGKIIIKKNAIEVGIKYFSST